MPQAGQKLSSQSNKCQALELTNTLGESSKVNECYEADWQRSICQQSRLYSSFLQQPGDRETILHLADQSDVWPINVAETKQNRMSDFEALQLTTYNNTSSRLAVSHKGYDVLTAL